MLDSGRIVAELYSRLAVLREGRARRPQETISAGLLLGSQVEEGGYYVGDVHYDVLFDGQVACKRVLVPC